VIVVLGGASFAFAHGARPHGDTAARVGPRNWTELATSWEFDAGVVIPLAISGVLYALGLFRLWRAAGVGRGVRMWEAICFALGWLTLVVALVSPLHPWGSMLFSAHMVQHELLMLVAAPLLVLSRPLVAMLKAVPVRWARRASQWTTARSWRRIWGFIVHPFVAWLIHAAVLWIWHIPALFDATNGNDFVHALQHSSFVVSALLFWWAVMRERNRAIGYGAATLYLFTTAIHSGLLGALITFAPVVWYPSYLHTTMSWGMTPLEDQQIGGLIMWVPACVSYIIAGLALFAAWLRDSEGRVARWERSADRPAAPEVVREPAREVSRS
jgi:cytochrome c oxidase assembly factor CtaG